MRYSLQIHKTLVPLIIAKSYYNFQNMSKDTSPKRDKIIIRGARVNNLKNVDIDVPRNQLVVVTGLSGSGKSSLAFDLIYAEGNRRYLEEIGRAHV